MRRIHGIEIADQSWCPNAIRSGVMDFLRFMLNCFNCYAPTVPWLRTALKRSGDGKVLDLCSGSGGPWPRLLRMFKDAEIPREVRLTEKRPDVSVFRHVAGLTNGRITYDTRSIDSTDIPQELDGFRTLFTSFHHFRSEQASAILADAVKKRVGIGVFEFTMRTPLAIAFFGLSPLPVLLFTPFIRPFRWSRILLTYFIPIIPLVAAFDGVMSCLRTYSLSELHRLVEPYRDTGYVWEIGRQRSWRFLIPITYLIGYPKPDPLKPRGQAR